jgi:hypothetical protein
VAIPAFFKKVVLELFWERTLETTSALANLGYPSATASACIVSFNV